MAERRLQVAGERQDCRRQPGHSAATCFTREMAQTQNTDVRWAAQRQAERPAGSLEHCDNDRAKFGLCREQQVKVQACFSSGLATRGLAPNAHVYVQTMQHLVAPRTHPCAHASARRASRSPAGAPRQSRRPARKRVNSTGSSVGPEMWRLHSGCLQC